MLIRKYDMWILIIFVVIALVFVGNIGNTFTAMRAHFAPNVGKIVFAKTTFVQHCGCDIWPHEPALIVNAEGKYIEVYRRGNLYHWTNATDWSANPLE
jgi:hypothetical protein